MVIQKFDIAMDDPSYMLEIKQQLTVKPKGFYVHAVPRRRSASPIAVAPTSTLVGLPQVSKSSEADVEVEGKIDAKHRLYVVYGSNTGTSQTFAQRIASEAPRHGTRFFLRQQDLS